MNYANMDPLEEGALHRHYERSTGETAVWYVYGLLLGVSCALNERAFNLYADRWAVCPNAIALQAMCFGYYHSKVIE